MLGLCCCAGFSLAVASRGNFPVVILDFSLHQLPLFFGAQSLGCVGFSSHGTWAQSCGSWAPEHWLHSGGAYSVARGIFPDQGSNLCLLHWQADSLPLSHQGGPTFLFFFPTFNLYIFVPLFGSTLKFDIQSLWFCSQLWCHVFILWDLFCLWMFFSL